MERRLLNSLFSVLSLLALTFGALGVIPTKAAGAPPPYYPSSPQANVDESQLTGWEMCWSSLYNSSADTLVSIQSQCSGEYLLLAGGPVGSTVFDVVAAGPRADVLFDTGTDRFTTHNANGVGWYYNSNWSWGYALEGDPVDRFSCDVLTTPNNGLRLCWHTGGGYINGGYRSGANIGLNSSTAFRRAIYQPAPGAFGKTSPANTATSVSASPTLRWGSSSGQTDYQYCYDSNINGACDGTWTSTSNATSVNLSGLNSSTQYEWQVRAVDGVGATEADSGEWWTFTTLPDCSLPGNLISNCSFETGNFSGWITQDLTSPFYSLRVSGAGNSPGFGFFSSAPTKGSYAALTGFDGNGPGTIRVAQDVSLPARLATLTFDYRAAWDLKNYGATTDREFRVTIEPAGGGGALYQQVILVAPAHTINNDTGNLGASMDLSAFAGQAIRISFDWWVPQPSSGPAFAQLDNIRLEATSGLAANPLSWDFGNQVKGTSSMAKSFTLANYQDVPVNITQITISGEFQLGNDLCT